MAARLAGPVGLPVDSPLLPSSGGAVAASASTGVDAVFAKMIATLTEANPPPKTSNQSLPTITVSPPVQQEPTAGQTESKAPLPSNSAAGPPAQRSVKALQSASRDVVRTNQAPDAAPQDPNPPAARVADAIAPPLLPASPSASVQPAAAGRGDGDNDPRAVAVGSTAALSSRRAEPPAAAVTPPAVAVATVTSETRSAAPFALPNSTPTAAAPQGSPSPPPIVATAAAIAATPATQPAPAPAAPAIARTTTPQTLPPASTPAAQIAPTLISVAQSASGTQRLTIRLDPPELGTLQIRVEHPTDAPMQVEINVQRPETLTLLMRDQPHLQHALDQAGVPAEGRTLSFHLDPQDQGGTAGDPGGGQGRRAPMPQPAARQMQADQDDPGDPTAGTMRWSRVALDITA